MHDEVLDSLQFEHGQPPGTAAVERRTWVVVALTAGMMVVELAVGLWSGSKALEADGWHMGTHAGAIGLAGLAYWFARTRAGEVRFSFGTGKVHALAAWSNALLLLLAAFWVIGDSAFRMWRPVEIRFEEALIVAVLGLVVNLVSARLLQPGAVEGTDAPTDHESDAIAHGHSHGRPPDADLNQRSAYLHVLLDLLTSVAAIVALLGGWLFGMGWLDPVIGFFGGALILRWGVALLREAGVQLLDMAPTDEALVRVKKRLESIDDVRVADLHIWDLGYGRRACMVSIVTENPRQPGYYRAAVLEVVTVQHLTVEVHRCPHPCGEVA